MEKRKWYPTKAQWAAAKARELRADAQRMPPSPTRSATK